MEVLNSRIPQVFSVKHWDQIIVSVSWETQTLWMTFYPGVNTKVINNTGLVFFSTSHTHAHNTGPPKATPGPFMCHDATLGLQGSNRHFQAPSSPRVISNPVWHLKWPTETMDQVQIHCYITRKQISIKVHGRYCTKSVCLFSLLSQLYNWLIEALLWNTAAKALENTSVPHWKLMRLMRLCIQLSCQLEHVMAVHTRRAAASMSWVFSLAELEEH